MRGHSNGRPVKDFSFSAMIFPFRQLDGSIPQEDWDVFEGGPIDGYELLAVSDTRNNGREERCLV